LCDQALVDFEEPFPIRRRAAVVAQLEHAQLHVRQPRGFRKAFERERAVYGAVALRTQRGGGKRLRGAVDEAEASFERERIAARILEQRAAEPHEGDELRARRRLRFQFTASLEPSQVGGYQRRFL